MATIWSLALSRSSTSSGPHGRLWRARRADRRPLVRRLAGVVVVVVPRGVGPAHGRRLGLGVGPQLAEVVGRVRLGRRRTGGDVRPPAGRAAAARGGVEGSGRARRPRSAAAGLPGPGRWAGCAGAGPSAATGAGLGGGPGIGLGAGLGGRPWTTGDGGLGGLTIFGGAGGGLGAAALALDFDPGVGAVGSGSVTRLRRDARPGAAAARISRSAATRGVERRAGLGPAVTAGAGDDAASSSPMGSSFTGGGSGMRNGCWFWVADGDLRQDRLVHRHRPRAAGQGRLGQRDQGRVLRVRAMATASRNEWRARTCSPARSWASPSDTSSRHLSWAASPAVADEQAEADAVPLGRLVEGELGQGLVAGPPGVGGGRHRAAHRGRGRRRGRPVAPGGRRRPRASVSSSSASRPWTWTPRLAATRCSTAERTASWTKR